MFCNGKCIEDIETEHGTVHKRCGLYITQHLVNDRREHKEVDVCVFKAMLRQLARLENRSEGVQRAVESSRNEGVEASFRLDQSLAQGFLGLIYSLDDHDRKHKMIQLLKNTEAKALENLEKEKQKALPNKQQEGDRDGT